MEIRVQMHVVNVEPTKMGLVQMHAFTMETSENGLLMKISWKITFDEPNISKPDIYCILFLFQGKQLCLAIVRTVILERRPVSMVTRAIDALVSSYSNSIKSGCYFKGIKAEKPPTPSASNINISTSVVNESIRREFVLGKSIKHGSASGVENESFNRSPAFPVSGSEENVSLENSNDHHSLGTKADRENFTAGESSQSEVQKLSLQSQLVGPSNSPLNASISENLESQVTSAAISPDEMYSFVFASVEEEMAGDPVYFVAIVVEFLRRYAV